MLRPMLRSMAGVLAWACLCPLPACEPSQPRTRDSGTASMDGNAGQEPDAGGPDAMGEPAPPMAGRWSPPRPPPSVCALSVGAQCDGREDCPDGQFCCAHFDSATFRYDSVRCQTSCGGASNFELCHDGDTCSTPGFVCRPSVIAQFDFIAVCAQPLPVPAETASDAVAGQIACGKARSCDVGSEQCCLGARYYFSTLSTTWLEPYCAPIGEECSCDSEPTSTDSDAGSESPVDAGPADDAG